MSDPSNSLGESIAEKLDQLLADDRNFDTRAGLRFMTELVRDAFRYIEAEKKRQEEACERDESIDKRVGTIETNLNDFLAMRAKEQEKNEAERNKWRWAIITPTLGLIIAEVARWLLNKP